MHLLISTRIQSLWPGPQNGPDPKWTQVQNGANTTPDQPPGSCSVMEVFPTQTGPTTRDQGTTGRPDMNPAQHRPDQRGPAQNGPRPKLAQTKNGPGPKLARGQNGPWASCPIVAWPRPRPMAWPRPLGLAQAQVGPAPAPRPPFSPGACPGPILGPGTILAHFGSWGCSVR